VPEKLTVLRLLLAVPNNNGVIAGSDPLARICIPVILVTAFPNEQHRRRALHNGAVGFLNKPFEEGSLISCINAAIKHAPVASGSEKTAATVH
jgi:FixJ family two-component response regulator